MNMTREEAIEVYNGLINTKIKEAFEFFAPELRESEDERMLREIKRYIKEQGNKPTGLPNGTVAVSDMIAWLEKQKEQKPEEKPVNWTELTWEDIVELEGIINNVHYEFHNGIGQESFGKEVLERFRSTKGIEYLDEAEQKYWREEGQKEQKLNPDKEELIRHCIGLILTDATDERFKDYGLTLKDCLTWIGEQKEHKPEEIAPNQFDGITYGMKGYSTEKPAEWNEDWREEDIQTRFAFYTYKNEDGVLYLSNVFVEEASRNHGFGTRILRAAEKVAETIGATTISLKVKQDSPANAWYRKNGYGYVAFEDEYDWLEKNLEYMKPNKQEWSEEDTEMYINVASSLRGYACGLENEEHKKHIKKGLDWLENRFKSLRPRWRPSEEQMEALFEAMQETRPGWLFNRQLVSLYDDLKKL